MIAYLIKSAVCLLLLLLLYHAFLEREKMHHFNRWFLIGSLILGFTVPLVTINMGASPQLSDQISEINRRLAVQQPMQTQALPEATPQTPAGEPQSNAGDSSAYWLIGLYLIVASVLAVRLLRNLHALYSKIKSNTHVAWQKATLVLVDEDSPPHSFWGYIFVDRQLYQSGKIKPAVLTHELAHIRQKHSIDILFIELLKVVFWFNPVLYFYKRAMQLNHEFLADEAVLSDTNNVQQYQKLLLKFQSSEKDLQLASSIQFYITKKRIVMMTKTTSRLRMICKQLALIPVLAGLIFAFSTRTTSAQDVEQMSLTELMNAVNERIDTTDSLTTDEQEQLRSLMAKMQEKLMSEPPPPPPPIPKDAQPAQKLESIYKAYQEYVTYYNNINAVKANQKKLKEAYERVQLFYDKIGKIQDEVYDNPPPLPPKPLEPEKLIDQKEGDKSSDKVKASTTRETD